MIREEQAGSCPPQQQSCAGNSNVVYIGHLPHGFYEKELKGFFSQFGTVRRVRVARSTKTFRSKGYAFVEFKSDEVARIAAQAMDGYFMFKKVLVCKVLSPERVHEKLFRKLVKIPWKKIERAQRAKPMTKERKKRLQYKQKRRNKERQEKLKQLGISFSFP
eukprot:jgi/Galph1/1286/GphlegSOOS_G6006.1